MNLRFSTLASVFGYQHYGKDVMIDVVSIDTRSLNEGDVFFALKGDNFDGHGYLNVAFEQGAAGLVVEVKSDLDLPQLVVPNAHQALKDIAAFWRQQHQPTVVGITGSNGKTTLKEMVATILSQYAKTLSTAGNFNNEIGLPLTVLNLSTDHQYAVFEMGANHRGEISRLTKIAQPNVAVINNVGRAHVEGFGSVEAIAEAKAEIYQGLETGGVAVINADDHFYPDWRSKTTNYQQISFGFSSSADVRVEVVEEGLIKLFFDAQEAIVKLALLGRHNACNAAAVTAVCLGAGLSFDQIVDALPLCKAYQGRLQKQTLGQHCHVIDDSYNANPDSVKAAIDVLEKSVGRRTLVLGDMGELGVETENFHKQIGHYAHQSGIDCVMSLGELAAQTSAAFGPEGLHFESHEKIALAINQYHKEQTVLIKGSRKSAMEKVITYLQMQRTGVVVE